MEVAVVTFLIILFAVIYDLSNGWNDASNAIATVVGTRVLTPAKAVVFGVVLNFIGALFSSEVARTVGHEIADPSLITQTTFLAAVIVAPVWITWCTLKGLPISCSHSLLGGLVGSVLASAGPEALRGAGLKKILFGVFVSPVAGFILGFILVVVVARLFHRIHLRTGTFLFGKLQLVSAGAMAFAHGTGDAQKAMGIITGSLLAGGYVGLGPDGRMEIPFWVRLLCAGAMAIGTAVGGWAVMRTLGSKLTHLRTYQGFAAETAASATILANTLAGVPLSTTHSITGAVIGVGAAHRARAVKWGIGGKIVNAWFFTFPVCIAGGAAANWLLRAVGLH
ncbi:MAG: inorganic phosphate transporter [Planctomycetota bacterium]